MHYSIRIYVNDSSEFVGTLINLVNYYIYMVAFLFINFFYISNIDIWFKHSYYYIPMVV